MAVEIQSQEEVHENQFRRQLAACVRSIQWSYAIFWSLSTSQEGLLEWSDGYYNGDIKTRKTTQPTECKAEQLGLQRSEQLRELYESLSTGDGNQQTKRPSASLSPEDLTDAEWYYLVCMSFTFNMGQDLPGKALERNEPIWLSNAQFADNRSFCRSLLAKTVVCLPFMDGVLELGTSGLVLEDSGFMHNITTSFWEIQVSDFSEHSISSPLAVGNEHVNVRTIRDHEVDDTMMFENHGLIMEDGSPTYPFSFHSNALNKEAEIINDETAEHHQSIFKEILGTTDDSSNVRENPFRIEQQNELTNGCASWSFTHNILSSPKGERVRNNMLGNPQEEDLAKFGALGFEADGSHYASTISAILRNLKPQTSLPCFALHNVSRDSGFKIWTKDSNTLKGFSRSSQKILKKVLMGKNWLNGGRFGKHQEESVPRNKACKSEVDDANANHVLSERRRREKLNEKFLILRSLVPSISKVDKASILADTIEYLKELERRVEELEYGREEEDPDIRERRKHPDITERTSDNYGNNELINCQKPSTNKRKACEIEEVEGEYNSVFDINVTMLDKEVLVEMHCTWRDFLLLDIIEAMSNLRLDTHSVQSSTVNGALSITLRAKVRNNRSSTEIA
ncbi:Transcription factor EGL1 [Apostasia shenzhenica]|uniref:Transcription factor EGL1 n=1 Tax=Apostasia shenzhenica TaxID=1088818 RepID=A0A2H9ZY71_9ASPA|nr:Transcription factor EGL1 [Apostasia shenzhenica]